MPVFFYLFICGVPMLGFCYILLKFAAKHPDYRNKYNPDYKLFARKGDNPYNLH